MPRGNRTGPIGLGPLTGRKAGNCVESSVTGYRNFSLGRKMLSGIGSRNSRFSRLTGIIPPIAYMAYRVVGRLNNNNDQTDQERW